MTVKLGVVDMVHLLQGLDLGESADFGSLYYFDLLLKFSEKADITVSLSGWYCTDISIVDVHRDPRGPMEISTCAGFVHVVDKVLKPTSCLHGTKGSNGSAEVIQSYEASSQLS